MTRLALLVSAVFMFSPSVALAQQADDRVDAGVFVTYVLLEEIGSRDAGPGTSAMGLGGRVSRKIASLFDGEGEVVVHPNAGVSGARVQAFAGLKAGPRFRRFGVFARSRPGLIWFAKDPFGVARPGSTPFNSQWARSLDASADLGATFEFYTRGGRIVRFDLSDTIVRYRARSVDTQLAPPRPVGGFTTHNRQWSIGFGARF